MSFGHLQTLPDMLIKTGESPALSQAVSAVALTSLAHRSCLEDLVPQARQAYGSALRSVYATFRDNPDLSSAAISSDRTLITILCLDFYEVISNPAYGDFANGGLVTRRSSAARGQRG